MSERVVIAHPERSERTRLASLLKGAGYEPLEAADGSELVARAPGAYAALVAAALPVLDGFAAAEHLHEKLGADTPLLVLLNDVYPVATPPARFLRELGFNEAVPSPAELHALENVLRRPRSAHGGRKGKKGARGASATAAASSPAPTGAAPRDESKPVDLTETPLLLVLARARRRLESAFIYTRNAGDALFLVLHKGDIALVRSNRRAKTDEAALLKEALARAEGEAFVSVDPALEDTVRGRIDLLPLLEAASAGRMAGPLGESAERSLAKARHTVFVRSDALTDRVAEGELTLFEHEILELVDGERSTSRLSGLAEAGALRLAHLLLRLEALGLVARKRPGTPKSDAKALPPAVRALLPEAPRARVETHGSLGAGDLAALLVRLECARATGMLAVKRDVRTVEIAFREGRLLGAHAWGGAPEEDPVQKLAAVSELRPEDVPAIRRLHAQRLVVEAVLAREARWAFRAGGSSRIAETPGTGSGSLVAELLRGGDLVLAAGAPPPEDDVEVIAKAFRLTPDEARGLGAWARGDGPARPSWLAATGPLLDASRSIGRSLSDASRALPAAPEHVPGAIPDEEDDLDAFFSKALDEGLREGTKAGAPLAATVAERAAPEAASAHPAASDAHATPHATGTVPAGAPAAVVAPPATAAASLEPSTAPSVPPLVAARATTPPTPSPLVTAPAPAPRLSVLPPRPAREPIPPLPEEDVPDDIRAFELSLGGGAQGSPQSFSMEQRSGGVVIRVGDREYAIDLLIREVEELRREKARMRSELVRRHGLLVEREEEVESVRKTVHELENFIAELQASIVAKERLVEEALAARGALDVQIAELHAVVPEKDRVAEQALASAEELRASLERTREKLREKERALEDLKREREGIRDRGARLEAELEKKTLALREAVEKLALGKERTERFEQDLAVARAERDDVTARLAAAETERKPRGFFRDARSTEGPLDERIDKAQKLAEERRKALEGIRAETITLSHRVIDLEGQVARREAEVARFNRDRERLEEKLATAQAEAHARAEAEQALLRVRAETERVLRDRTTALELTRDDIESLRALKQRLTGELNEARQVLAEREAAIADLVEQRAELRTKNAALEARGKSLESDLAVAGEEAQRLEAMSAEAQKTAERTTATLETVRVAREELSVRLAGTSEELSRALEETDRNRRESARLAEELAAAAEAHATREQVLGAKLDAARAEHGAALEEHARHIDEKERASAALDRRLETEAAEKEALQIELAASTRDLEATRARAMSLAERASSLEQSVEALSEQARLATADRRQASEVRTELERREDDLRETRAALAEARAESERRTTLVVTLLDRIQEERFELVARKDQVRRADLESHRLELASRVEAHKVELEETRDAHRRETDTRALTHRRELDALTDAVRKELAAAVNARRDESIAAAESKRREVESLTALHAQEQLSLRAGHEVERNELTQRAEERHQKVVAAEEKVATLARRDAALRVEIQKRDALLASLRTELEQSSNERRVLSEEIEKRVAEKVVHVQKLETGLGRLKEEATREISAWRARAKGLEERVQTLVEEQKVTRETVSHQTAEVGRLEGQMASARKRVAQDVRRISELVALADDLKVRVEERDRRIRTVEAELSRSEGERHRIEQELGARSAEVEAFRDAASDREKKLGEAREGLYALSQQDRELSQQLAEQEVLIANLKADLVKVNRERESLTEGMQARSSQEGREAQALARALGEARTELGRTRNLLREAQIRERETLARAARNEAASLEGGAMQSPSEDVLRARVRVLHSRTAELEQEIAEKLATEGILRSENESLYDEVREASSALEEAQSGTDALLREVEARKAADSQAVARIRDLEERLARATAAKALLARVPARNEAEAEAERLRVQVEKLSQAMAANDEAYALLDTTLAMRERLVEELERRLGEARAAGAAAPAPSSLGSEPELRARLEEAARALEVAAAERTARQGVERKLEEATAEKALLTRELRRLREMQARAPEGAEAKPAAAAAAATAAAADATARSAAGPEPPRAVQAGARPETKKPLPPIELVLREKGELVEASTRVDREAGRLRETIERKTKEGARLAAEIASKASGSPARMALETARQTLEDEVQTLRTTLGTTRSRMAELNKAIVERNRTLQQIIETCEGGAAYTGSVDAPREAGAGPVQSERATPAAASREATRPK